MWAIVLAAQRPKARRALGGFLRYYAGEFTFSQLASAITSSETRVEGPTRAGNGEGSSLSRVAWLAILTLLFVILWNALVARVTMKDLMPNLSDALAQFWNLLTAQITSKTPFSDTGGHLEWWDSVSAYLSIVLILAVLPIGFGCIWTRYRRNALVLALAVVAGAYPLTLGLRLTQAGTETSNRASEFTFAGIAFVLAVALVDWWPTWHTAILSERNRQGLFAMGTAVLLVGGICTGTAPSARLPGPYLVGGDQQSVDRAGVGAAYWAVQKLGPNNTVAADRMNRQIMGAYGAQAPVTAVAKGPPLSSLYFSSSLDPADRYIIKANKIAYVLVDRRLTAAVPIQGTYYDASEPPHEEPLPAADLAKFDRLRGASRVFDDGAISIYDVTSLSTCVSRSAGRALCNPRVPKTDASMPPAYWRESASANDLLSVLRAVMALLLVTILPGWALVSLLSLSARREGASSFVLVPGLSLFAVIAGGLILNLTPWGLQAGSWGVLLGGVTVCGAAVRIATTRLTAAGISRTAGFGILRRLRPAIATFPAIVVVGFAFALSSWGAADAQHRETQYTQFWLLPSALSADHISASLGISSVLPKTAHFAVRIMASGGDRLVREWPDITLKPGETWEARFNADLGGPGRLTADLYSVASQSNSMPSGAPCRMNDCHASNTAEGYAGPPFREVFLWHS